MGLSEGLRLVGALLDGAHRLDRVVGAAQGIQQDRFAKDRLDVGGLDSQNVFQVIESGLRLAQTVAKRRSADSNVHVVREDPQGFGKLLLGCFELVLLLEDHCQGCMSFDRAGGQLDRLLQVTPSLIDLS